VSNCCWPETKKWRGDRAVFFAVVLRRWSNGDQVTRVAALAMKHGKSVDFTERHISD
jgi:hypothetical protein